MQRRICSRRGALPQYTVLRSCGRVQSALILQCLRDCVLSGVGGGEISRCVCTAAAVEAVRTRPARELVAAAAAAQTVVASAAGQDVAATVATQHVIPNGSCQLALILDHLR